MMGRGTAADFSEATRRHGELNDRQHMVLELVAKGRTNWQIAEQLGVTLDGAKWHVGELLGIFGFSTREQLAEYYRWHNRLSARLGRAVRALVSFPFARPLVGVGVVAGTVAVVGAVLIAGHESGKSASGGTIPPFELTAQFRVPVDDPKSVTPHVVRISHSHWWFAGPDNYRIEMEDPGLAGTSVITAIGRDGILYHPDDNTYQRVDRPASRGKHIYPPAFGIMIGPLPYMDLSAYIDSFARSNPWLHEPALRVVGHEVLLGRPVTVVQEAVSSYPDENGGMVNVEPSARAWIDEERMFVMKSASSAGPDANVAEVTWLEYGLPGASQSASFTLPPGAREVSVPVPGADARPQSIATVDTGNIGGRPPDNRVPVGFLTVDFIPVRYRWISSGAERNHSGELSEIRLEFAAAATTDSATYLVIEQRHRLDGVPARLVTSNQATVNGHEAYRGTSGAARTLAWEQDGVAILITSDTLPYDELERIAASMHP